ncbi:BTB/POZ domain-containing protein 9 [Paramecium bursaria]
MLQQENSKQTNEANLFCEVHSNSQLVSINIGEKKQLKSRMLSTKCLIDLLNNEEKCQKLIYLQDFMKNPGSQLLKSIKIKDESKIDENEALLDIENLLIKIEGEFKTQLANIRQNIIQMKQTVGSIVTELENNLNLNELIKQFELLKKMDSYQGTKELTQFEEQLKFVSVNLVKTYAASKEKYKDNQLQIIQNFQNNFILIKQQIGIVNKTSMELLNKIVCFMRIIDDLTDFPQIHQQISDGKQIYYQLLYSSTTDGLNGQSYWSKCDQQSHLLTIMTSKNGNKFGGYSPCCVNSSLKAYVQDPTMKSFLFQYNKREIYKIKSQAYAIYCNAIYGPTYGGHDIYIGVDFNGTGHNSGLGNSYDISNYNIVDKANHIFGATTPQLQECKIKQTLFIIICELNNPSLKFNIISLIDYNLILREIQNRYIQQGKDFKASQELMKKFVQKLYFPYQSFHYSNSLQQYGLRFDYLPFKKLS